MENYEINENTIIKQLRGLKDAERAILQLDYEIENYDYIIDGNDLIDSINFQRSGGIEVRSKIISDRTATIAINHEEKAQLAEQRRRQSEIKRTLLKRDVERLKFYISFLDEREKLMIEKIYIEECTLNEVATQMDISVSTVRRIQKKAIRTLTEMYRRLFKT